MFWFDRNKLIFKLLWSKLESPRSAPMKVILLVDIFILILNSEIEKEIVDGASLVDLSFEDHNCEQ